MKKTVLAVSLIAVLTLSGCSTTPADGSTESGNISDVTIVSNGSIDSSEALSDITSDVSIGQPSSKQKASTVSKPQSQASAKAPSKTSAVPKVTGEKSSSATKASSSATPGQINALRSAKSYLNYSNFSYEGLIDQLEYEKYSHDDAVYAADHCGADWNEQAAKKAKSYLEHSAFSRDGLIAQLEYEGFSHEQAVYGAEANGL